MLVLILSGIGAGALNHSGMVFFPPTPWVCSSGEGWQALSGHPNPVPLASPPLGGGTPAAAVGLVSAQVTETLERS